jgi:hypothetical protein
MTSSDSNRDAENLAFEALLPLAKPTADALERVDKAVLDERNQMDRLRSGFGTTLKAGLSGLGRFGYAVREVGLQWAGVPNVRAASTPQQEASNVFLWSVGDRYALRIKHDPIEGVAEGTQRLFAQLPAADRPSTIFLTWGIGLDDKILSPRFVCVDEPKWTISLAQLLAHDMARPTPMPAPARRGPIVRSKTKADDQKQREG